MLPPMEASHTERLAHLARLLADSARQLADTAQAAHRFGELLAELIAARLLELGE